MKAANTERGSVLLLALAILALLSMFVVSFARLVSLERLASSNYVLGARARLLAEAGVARACGSARDTLRQRAWSSPSDWWAAGTLYPALGATRRLNLGENAFGGEDLYEVRSLDCSARLNVNQRTPGLGRALELVGCTAAQASAILAARDAGLLRSQDDLRRTLGISAFNTLRDVLTVWGAPKSVAYYGGAPPADLPWIYEPAWTLAYPVNVNLASQEVLAAVLANVSARPILYGEGSNVANWVRTAYQGARSMAGAGPVEVIDEALAAAVAAEIVACRNGAASPGGAGNYGASPFGGGFTSWARFHEFLDGLMDNGVVTRLERSLIGAVAEPNARPMGYNPDFERRRGDPEALIDKAGLISWTAELCLGPSGVQEVRARGWIEDRDGVVLAESVVERVVRVAVAQTWSTQVELESVLDAYDTDVFQSMPEHVGRTDVSQPADPGAGHFRLTTEATALAGPISTAFRNAGSPSTPFTFSRPPLLLREGGALGPDGVVVWRRDWERDGATLARAGAPAAMAQRGSLEFWVKLAHAPGVGSDEVLLAVNTMLSGTTGTTVKLERWKSRIRATWFFWGVPDARSPYRLTMAEASRAIDDWRPGEWHHVSTAWDSLNGIQLFIDAQGGVLERFDYETWERGPVAATFEGMVKYSMIYHMGTIASLPPTDTIWIGGFSLTPTGGLEVQSTGTTPSQSLPRYPNCTIDDVAVYERQEDGAARRTPDLRYAQNGSSVAATLRLPLPPGFEPASVTWTAEVPTGCRVLVGGVGDTVPPALRGSALTVVGDQVVVPVVLQGPGFNTPVLEDVTLYSLPPQEVLEETEPYVP